MFNTVDCGNLGRLFIDEMNYADKMDKNSKITLHASVVEILQSAEVESNILAKFTEEMVDITNFKNILRGTVQCVVCLNANNEKNPKENL